MLGRYQKEIKGMNMNLRSVGECTDRVMAAKGRLIQMTNAAKHLHSLRKEVDSKQRECDLKK